MGRKCLLGGVTPLDGRTNNSCGRESRIPDPHICNTLVGDIGGHHYDSMGKVGYATQSNATLMSTAVMPWHGDDDIVGQQQGSSLALIFVVLSLRMLSNTMTGGIDKVPITGIPYVGKSAPWRTNPGIPPP